jgi:hypothetical protein
MGINTFDREAIEVIVRSSENKLRFSRNLYYAGYIKACRETQKIEFIKHVNTQVLIQFDVPLSPLFQP